MKFTMVRPCAHCPFRSDIPGYLHPERAKEIAASVVDRGEPFPCHETLAYSDDGDVERMTGPDSQHCAGALILNEKLRRPGQLARIAGRLGMYDCRRLDMAAPVFATARAFIRHHSEGKRDGRKQRH